MNIQEYILSGIVESNVLGLASDEERREFEQMCRQYPEVLQARVAFELALEKQAMANAVAPAAGLKNKILEEVDAGAKVVSISAAPLRKMNGWKYAAAACIALLAGSIYLNVSLSGKNKKLKGEYDKTAAKLDVLEKDFDVLHSESQSIKMAALKGTDVSPQSYTTVFWDTTSHDVYLMATNLPAPADSMQYQLWALFDGTPIDLGMLDYDLKQKKLLVRMKNAQNAQAFAITLEKKGRTNVNTPEGQMYVLGKL